MAVIEVKVPDIGDFSEIPVISVMVSEGDTVAAEDPLIELESDKATMEVPSPQAGKVVSLKLKEGDKVSEGALILTLETEAAAGEAPAEPTRTGRVSGGASAATSDKAGYGSAAGYHESVEIRVPDIGDFTDIPVINVLVSEGQEVAAEDPLIELESDKATMEVPSPMAGKIVALKVKEGDKVSEGSVIATLSTGETAVEEPAAPAAPAPASTPTKPVTGDIHA
ncbi:MAG: biotin/lipoyl-containing protein, partial [Pseudomonadota bacterium]